MCHGTGPDIYGERRKRPQDWPVSSDALSSVCMQMIVSIEMTMIMGGFQESEYFAFSITGLIQSRQ